VQAASVELAMIGVPLTLGIVHRSPESGAAAEAVSVSVAV
jgi:hypothetical protein